MAMKDILNERMIDIPCPSCGRKNPKSFRWLKQNKNLTCNCGVTTSVDTAEYKKALADVERELAALEKTLKNFGKK